MGKIGEYLKRKQPKICVGVSVVWGKAFLQRSHKVLPLAPYSPELNPIEKVWANIKRYLRTVLSDYARFDDALLSYFDFN
ncbi:hypothetical protein NM96_02895 [Neisseria mucosa]|uniref:Tc1-like transposase DDE domain-containing protein n=1 Tax=Neisseria mucosa TaxID=488 RepID=A0ABN4Y9W7_NEIMU|nr:hypothetical protein A6J88_08205 [Neisseria mucosa]AVR78442.1 hypothetical protein NM96_02895 [Neisseria mucosa]